MEVEMSQSGLEVTLPSGLTGRIRSVRLGDIKRLVEEPKGGRPHDPLVAFLSGLWQETLDPGIYVWPNQNVISPGGAITWSHALQGDTSALLLDAREATFGSEVHFEPVCPERGCKHAHKWRFSLSDLKREGLSEAAKDAIRVNGIGHEFDFHLPRADVTVGWKCLTRGDQYRIDATADGNDAMLGELGMLARLPRIPGATDPGRRQRFVLNMDLYDVSVLREEYEHHDAFVQDTIEIRCPKCKTRNQIAIPINKDFFSVSSARAPEIALTEFIE